MFPRIRKKAEGNHHFFLKMYIYIYIYIACVAISPQVVANKESGLQGASFQAWNSHNLRKYERATLPETNMETQKGLYKDYSPLERSSMDFHVSLGECI